MPQLSVKRKSPDKEQSPVRTTFGLILRYCFCFREAQASAITRNFY